MYVHYGVDYNWLWYYLVEYDAIHRPEETKKFCVYPEMNRNVGILRIFPGITHATVKLDDCHNIICFRIVWVCTD